MSAHKAAVTKAVTKPAVKLAAAKASPKRAPKPAGKVRAKAPAAVKAVAAKPAPVEAARGDEVSGAAKKLAAEIDRALSQGHTDLLSADAIQALMAAACRSYSAQIEAGLSFPPLAARSRVTSTDVMVTASGLLKSANLAVFELGMWQSWTGR
jgi:hypothetical protein